MTTLLALDVALLPPPDAAERAIRLSAALPTEQSKGLLLGPEHLPHITLTQQFVRVDELPAVFDRIDEIVRDYPPLELRVSGGGTGGSSVWMAIDATPALIALHERLMESLRGFERAEGGPGAFADGDARMADVLWVDTYRLKSAFGAFTPHITLGHADRPPELEPFAFTANTVAACHLGRFCTCRRVLRRWELPATSS